MENQRLEILQLTRAFNVAFAANRDEWREYVNSMMPERMKEQVKAKVSSREEVESFRRLLRRAK